jgi:parvulin-like peptidyl-prolyl isomerase
MTKIRENLSTAFAVFAGVFVVYIVLDWGMDITGRKQASQGREAQEVGSIDGASILYKDFAEMLKQAADNQKASTGTEPDENQMRALRDQIWNQLVDDKLFEAEIKRLGIQITDQEIVDWVRGSNPPEILASQFVDSTGMFNRAAYENAILDPRNKEIMLRVEDILRRQRLREKLQSIVSSGVRVSEGDIAQRFSDQTIQNEITYALFDPNVLVKDTDISFTDDDLRTFYNEHSQEFKTEATRKLKYVTFSEAPSKSDSDAVINELNDIVRRVKEGADFLELAKTYSDVPPADAFFKHGELTPAREKVLFDARPGEVVGPVMETDGAYLLRVDEFKPGAETFYRASHILIAITNNDSVAALASAREALAQIKGGRSFADVAREKSTDRMSAAAGGDIGWFSKGRMVKPFEDAVAKTSVGQIAGPVRTPFGYHVIRVTGKDAREVKFTSLKMEIRMSSQTREMIGQQAQDFHYLATEGDFTKTAEQEKYKVTETAAFQKDAMIPGIGMNSAISKFAFNGSLGDISQVISVQSGDAIFQISEVKQAGVRPFEEVKASLEARVRREKKMEKVRAMAAEMRATLSPGDSLTKLQGQKPGVTVVRVGPFTVSGGVGGLGRDWGLIGGLAALKVGDISKPIEGSRGYYLAQLLNRTAFDSTMYGAQRDILARQILNEQKGRFVGEWFDKVKKAATIVDNRDMFYR